MHPSRNLAQGFTSKRNVDFAPLFSALDESGSFEQLQVFGHGIQSGVEWLRNFEKPRRPVCESANNCSPSGVGNGYQNVCQLIHADITP